MPRQTQPKVTFYIDKNNKSKNGLAPIKANICLPIEIGRRWDKKKEKEIPVYFKTTKIIDHILPSDWNTNQQRVKPPRPGKTNGRDLINKILEELVKDFEEFARRCKLNRIELTPDVAKKFLNGERSLTEKAFWQSYKEYLDSLSVQPKTKQSYTLYHTKLKEFEEETRYFIDYQTIDTVFFEKYKHYILAEKGLGWNTFATAIKKLKFFMNWSLKQKYHSETGYKEFSATEKEPTVIFLTIDELTTLYRHDFESKRLNQVRDKFCFGCFTGLAYSDLDSLTREHINDGTLTKLRNKTKNPLSIELAKPALEIIKRYQDKYKALPKISPQKFNEYIKECCKKVGIITPTVYKDFTGGSTTEKIELKYKLIGSHSARKTFITNFYNNTKDVNLTKKIAGITQDKTLRRYMGADKNMEKEAMNKAFGNL